MISGSVFAICDFVASGDCAIDPIKGTNLRDIFDINHYLITGFNDVPQ
jgi:hypothetical protein